MKIQVDMVNIRTGGGRQAFHHVSVGLVWKVTNSKRRDAKMTIFASFPCGTNVEFLMAECSKNLDKKEVLEMLEIEAKKLWIFMLDDALFRRKGNTTRKLIHDLAKVMENCLAEFYGPATLNLNLHPNVLNVTREVAENTSIITREVVNKLLQLLRTNHENYITGGHQYQDGTGSVYNDGVEGPYAGADLGKSGLFGDQN